MSKSFELSTLIESVAKEYAIKLGTNKEKPATILGYVSIPKLFNSKDLSEVSEYAQQKFGDNCKLLPIPTQDTLPDNMKKFVKGFSDNTSILYCLIYKQ